MSKLLTVFGATGKQGGSVIDHVQAHPQLSREFRIRAVTRDPNKDTALALAAKGCEVVAADMDNPISLRKAVEGSHTVFAVTDYWAVRSKYIEVVQGKAVIDAAATVGVQHLIWSNLPNVTKLSNGELSAVSHFDGKAEIGDHIESLGIPYTFFVPGYFMENLKTDLKRGNDDTFTISFPIPINSKFPLFSATEDTGLYVTTILLNAQKLIGKSLYGATGFYTVKQIIETFQRVTGNKAKYVEVPGETWKGFLPQWMAQEMLENYYLVRDYKYYGGDAEKDLKASLELVKEVGEPTSLESFFESVEW